MTQYRGIDISKWNSLINWKKVKADGVDFLMIREGYGKKNPNQIDKRFKENYNGAKAAGIPVGVYHYSYADSVADAKAEAEFCLENIKGMQLEYPVVFDLEDKEQLKLNNRQRTDIVKAFCETIENAGYYSMIYCNLNWYNNYLIKDELKQYDLWIAQWGVAKPSVNCGIWQYSDCGKIDGINGNVDLNVSYKDYPSIMKSKGLNGFKAGASSKKEVIYKVKKGDNLSKIAAKYNTTVSKIAKDNGIKDPNKIYPDQIIKIKR